LHLTKGLEVLIIGAVITLGAVLFGLFNNFGESATIAVGDIVPIVGLVVMLVGNQIRRNERKQQNVLC
jgi:hypothetical protein